MKNILQVQDKWKNTDELLWYLLNIVIILHLNKKKATTNKTTTTKTTKKALVLLRFNSFNFKLSAFILDLTSWK